MKKKPRIKVKVEMLKGPKPQGVVVIEGLRNVSYFKKKLYLSAIPLPEAEAFAKTLSDAVQHPRYVLPRIHNPKKAKQYLKAIKIRKKLIADIIEMLKGERF